MQTGGTRKREPPISGDEVDAIYCRHMYCYTQRSGVAAGIKRQIRRRERHKLNHAIRDEGGHV